MSQIAYIIVAFVLATVVVVIPLLTVNWHLRQKNQLETEVEKDRPDREGDSLPECC